MRDIRPAQPPPGLPPREVPSGEDEQQPRELYEATTHRKQQPLKKRDAFAVPVTNIHVPREHLVHSDEDHVPQAKQKPARPMFVTTPLAKKSGRVRVSSRERRILLSFFALVVVSAGITVFIFLPTAHIRLQLRTAPLLVDQRLVIRADGEGSGVIPGTAYMREVQVEGTFAVTNKEVVGKKSQGVVHIINRTFDEQKIKERSRLTSADGVLFYMLKHAIVSPAQEGTPSVVEVPVEAAEAGDGSNIEPQRLDFAALDPSSRAVVYAEAREAFAGGSGEEIAVASEEDLGQARASAQETARRQAEVEIREKLPQGWTILDETWTAELVSFETDAKIGDRIPSIAYRGQVTVRVMGYEVAALEAALRAALEAQLDKEFMLFPGPISYTMAVDMVDWDTAEAKVDIRVTHTTIPRLSLDTLRAKLAGRSEQEARDYLEGLSGVQSATVKLWPFWMRSIPRIEARIALELEPERQP